MRGVLVSPSAIIALSQGIVHNPIYDDSAVSPSLLPGQPLLPGAVPMSDGFEHGGSGGYLLDEPETSNPLPASAEGYLQVTLADEQD